MMMDSELAAHNAWKKFRPDIPSKIDAFHFSQSLVRNANKKNLLTEEKRKITYTIIFLISLL